MPRIHPKTWDDGVMPLSELPPTKQAQIAELVARKTPPPRWLRFVGCQIESRAWWEWHWSRGRRLRRVDGPNRVRKKIPAETRCEVYARDDHRCRHCGATENLSLDHIKPWSLGGSDEPDNLQTLCRSCNSRKGAKWHGDTPASC